MVVDSFKQALKPEEFISTGDSTIRRKVKQLKS